MKELASLSKDDLESKMNIYFTSNSQLSRSVQSANGSKNLLRLNMHWQSQFNSKY